MGIKLLSLPLKYRQLLQC